MTRALSRGSLLGLLMLGLACSNKQPTAPTALPAAAPPTVAQPPPPQPAGDPVAVYAFSGPLDYAVSRLTLGSQFLLYENGVFGLRYITISHVYLGTYQQDQVTVTFRFHPSNTDRLDATGSLQADLMEVRYSEMMQHSDFENAVYRRVECSNPRAQSGSPCARIRNALFVWD